MYRLYGALAVLGIIIILAFSAFRSNTDTTAQLSRQLEAAFSLAENGDLGNSQRAMDEAVSFLEKRSGLMCVFISHRMIDDIRNDMEKAQVYLSQGNKELFLACCRSAVFRTKDLSELEYPTLINIF